MMSERTIIAIPARHGATRLPGKPLRLLAGRPLIAHVVDRARALGDAEIVVATDDRRIMDVVGAMGVAAVMTRGDHATGSDRLAELANSLDWPDDAIVVNLQGDEPLMPASALHAVVDALRLDRAASAATLATPISLIEEAFDPACVKVVCDQSGHALYFSRAPIPWARDAWSTERSMLPNPPLLRHLGLYAYRASTLRRFTLLQQSPLERAESLEQLRLLENGLSIAVRLAPDPIPPGVDTEEDLTRVEAALLKNEVFATGVSRIIFVCLGNICRSPLAEGYARHRLSALGLPVAVASAGTISHHRGAGADPGSVAEARRQGFDLAGHCARGVADTDFAECDLVVALDSRNLADLARRCPASHRHKLVRLLDFAAGCGHRDVPDPYGGTAVDFGDAFSLIRAGVDGLVAQLLRGPTVPRLNGAVA
jgi:3-deoxy-manno-octulosonate cytidylyltransferase (CMP-KDO synthetase)